MFYKLRSVVVFLKVLTCLLVSRFKQNMKVFQDGFQHDNIKILQFAVLAVLTKVVHVVTNLDGEVQSFQ